MLSVLSPIERILDAYEQDRTTPSADMALAKYREQLRWGRLFERFTTFSFAPVEHVDRVAIDHPDTWGRADQAAWAALTRDQQRAVTQLLDEMRWLPTPVIETVVCRRITIASPDDRYPIDPAAYQNKITPEVIHWRLVCAPRHHRRRLTICAAR